MGDGIFKNFPRMNQAGIEGTDGNSRYANDFISGIKKDEFKMLIGFVFDACMNCFDNIFRIFNIKIF